MPSDGAVHRRVEELITVGILEVHEGTGAADLARDPFPELDPRLPEGGDILVRGIHLPPFTSTRHHRGHGVKVTTCLRGVSFNWANGPPRTRDTSSPFRMCESIHMHSIVTYMFIR